MDTPGSRSARLALPLLQELHSASVSVVISSCPQKPARSSSGQGEAAFPSAAGSRSSLEAALLVIRGGPVVGGTLQKFTLGAVPCIVAYPGLKTEHTAHFDEQHRAGKYVRLGCNAGRGAGQFSRGRFWWF